MDDDERAPVLAAFGSRVRDRRTALGLSQEALAERAQLHRTYVGSLERGERNVALVNIVRLAVALQVDATELVRDLPHPPAPHERPWTSRPELRPRGPARAT